MASVSRPGGRRALDRPRHRDDDFRKLITGLSLFDQFGESTTGTASRPKRFCNPARLDDDPSALSDPDHLTGYELDQTSPHFLPVFDVQVQNKFGLITVQLVRPDLLLVPSAKSLVAPPDPPTPAIDHFKCYRVHGRQRITGINVEDQFGTLVLKARRPARLCVPVDKNGEGIMHSDRSLLCYYIFQTSSPRFQHTDPFFVRNQFNSYDFTVTRATELCVDSTVIEP